MIVYLEAENLTTCWKEKCFKNVVKFRLFSGIQNLPDSFLIHVEHSSVTFKFQSKVREGVIF